MNGRALFAGPYFGEFGHEVLGTGLLRAKARGYGRVIVCSRPARAALYADIATEFRTHDIRCIGMCARATSATMPSPEKIQSYFEPDCERFPMPDCGNPATEALILQEGIYYRLGTVQDKWRGAAVIHARNRPHAPERNWPLSWWHRLARWILRNGIAPRIICVGTREQASLVEGCCDMRGSDLATQMDIGASAAFVVGPSSGWMHLASLCGCPHLVWVGGPEHGYVNRRYYKRWNPLGTRVDVIDAGTWKPEFGIVRDRLARFVEKH